MIKTAITIECGQSMIISSWCVAGMGEIACAFRAAEPIEQ